MGQFVIVIPPISIARELWRFGEDDLAARAFTLSADAAADIGERAGQLEMDGTPEHVWPTGPRGSTRAVMLATTEYFEGRMRRCVRDRRRAEKSLPFRLQRTEDELWAENRPVSDEMNRRLWAQPGAAPQDEPARGRSKRKH